MKSLIQIISTLSLITRKYLFGELFKKKKDESFVCYTVGFIIYLKLTYI